MAVISSLHAALADIGKIPFTVENDELVIPPSDENGFEIRVAEAEREILIICGDWHDHYSTEEDAVLLVLSALTPHCRARTVFRGKYVAQSYLEILKNGKWRIVSVVSAIFYPFWAKRREEIRSNNWILPEEPDSTSFRTS